MDLTAVPGEPATSPGAAHRRSLERLECLCDSGSLEQIRSAVVSPRLGGNAQLGDGVVAGFGRVSGRRIACYAQDATFMGGSLGSAQAETIDRVLAMAARARLPVVSFIESGGARMQEGAAALYGYGRIFRQNVRLSTIVPQISIIGGLAAGGGCYSPALTDFVVMTEEAKMFLTGPRVVREVTGEDITAEELGGHRMHEQNGVCHLVASSDHAAAALAQNLLGYLPQHVGGSLPQAVASDPAIGDPALEVPSSSRTVYDMRAASAGIVDAGSLLEISPRWGRSILTSFARIEGRSIGLIASQPRYLGGVLDVEASQKGARFVKVCDTFGIPLVVLVDTPGFMPGRHQEEAGVIRFGSRLLQAFAAARVPRLTVILRKAYGGAFIAMNSKGLGADFVFAWPDAEIGVMSAHGATAIIHRRELAAAANPDLTRDELTFAYAREHLGAQVAAAGGFIDEVIEPSETRARLAGALEILGDRDR